MNASKSDLAIDINFVKCEQFEDNNDYNVQDCQSPKAR